MSRYAFVSTDVLDIAYLEWNPQGARSAVLLHGWPDSPACLERPGGEIGRAHV